MMVASVGRASDSLQPAGLQDFCPQHIETVASSHALSQLHHSVEAFRVASSKTIVKVVKDGVSIGFDGQRKGDECISHIGRDLCEPCKVALQSIFFCQCFINGVKAFFETIGGLQTWEVLEPHLKDQSFSLIEVMRTLEQKKSVMHQGFPLFVSQTLSYLLANRFQAAGKQLQDVEFIYDQCCMGQGQMDGAMVRRPHISTDNLNMLFHSIGQVLQVGENGWFLSISKQINDVSVLNVSDDATVLIEQIQLVNPDADSLHASSDVEMLDRLVKDEPDKLLINADVVGDTRKCSSQCLLSDVKHQAICHHMMLVHLREWFKKGFVTVSAAVPFSDDQDARSFSSNWTIHKELPLDLMTIESEAGTMWAAQSSRFVLGYDVAVVFVLSNGQDTPMGPAKNIQRQLSPFRLLPKKFYVRGVNVVAREGRLLRVHSTHFSDFTLLSTVVRFHVVFRIAENIWVCPVEAVNACELCRRKLCRNHTNLDTLHHWYLCKECYITSLKFQERMYKVELERLKGMQ